MYAPMKRPHHPKSPITSIDMSQRQAAERPINGLSHALQNLGFRNIPKRVLSTYSFFSFKKSSKINENKIKNLEVPKYIHVSKLVTLFAKMLMIYRLIIKI